MFPHHPLAEKDAYTLKRAGKRTRRPELVVCVVGELGALGCGAGLHCLLRGCPSSHGTAVGIHHGVGGLNPVGGNRDRSAVDGDPQRLRRAGQDPVRVAVGWVHGTPYCILPEKDVGRVRQNFVNEDRWGRVTRCRALVARSGGGAA